MRSVKIALCGIAASFALVAQTALATTEFNKTIKHVGAQAPYGYVLFTTPTTGNCLWGNLYIDLNNDGGKAYYSLLLSAYLSGKPISRVDYELVGNLCMITLVEV
jgi:hypothetical protein